MKKNRNLPLTLKLALAIVITGLIPAAVIGFLAVHTANHLAEDIGDSFHSEAENITDKVDRNLFERYGDVQAFGANDAVRDQKSWYRVGSESNKVAIAANAYANLYGFYLLSYVVDLEGRVIAVNDKDPAGKAIDTAWLYQKNFKGADWFADAVGGHFLKSATLDGTVVQDLHVDEDVKRAYGSDGLVLGFSAPVKDAAGKTIGVWHNCANFSLVEEIVVDVYGHMKKAGMTEAELSIIDRTGRLLMSYDPSANAGKEAVQHDLNVLLKSNLAEQGVKAAHELVGGNSGYERSVHPQKKHATVTGYAVCDGELGFPGLKWGVLLRVPERQAFAAMHSQVLHIAIVIGASILGLITMGWWLGRSISRPLVQGIEAINSVGAQVTSAAKEFSTSSQSVAEGASEQAASLEETSASLEEIASMTKRNAENATNGTALGRQARDSANAGLERIGEMGRTLNAIKTAVGEMQSAVSEMQSSSQEISKIIKTIDEIAFQTNLLALNAAVEAARAGEAGMGFAVVADEVRSLAQRSAQAAKDTSDKIESAVKRSEFGGAASAKVVKSLGEVEVTAHSIEQVFNGIVTQIKSLDQVVSEIAGASKEQSQGINEVNMAVGQMDKVTQTNAASAEENASAAEELNSQVGSLQNIVGQLQTMVLGHSEQAGTVAVENRCDAPKPVKQPKTKPQPAVQNGRNGHNGQNGSAHVPAFGLDIQLPEPAGHGHDRGSFKDF